MNIANLIGDQEVNSVSARDLYLDLGLTANNWTRWSKENIVENEFLKLGIDFIELLIMSSSNNGGKTHCHDGKNSTGARLSQLLYRVRKSSKRRNAKI
jgi:phage anti-repressor protein